MHVSHALITQESEQEKNISTVRNYYFSFFTHAQTITQTQNMWDPNLIDFERKINITIYLSPYYYRKLYISINKPQNEICAYFYWCNKSAGFSSSCY